MHLTLHFLHMVSRMRLPRPIMVLVLLGCSTPVMLAESQRLLLSFFDSKGKPLRKVEVRLIQFGDGGLPQGTLYARSNKQGVAEFNELLPSTSAYRIDAQLKDYSPLTLVIDPSAGASIGRTLLRQKEFEQRERKANQALEGGKYEMCIEGLKELIVLYPGDAVLHDNLARCYAGKLDHENALAEAEIAAELEPERFASTPAELEQQILHGLGDRALYEFQFELAVRHFTALKELNPESSLAYHGLALAYGHQGKVKPALEAINRAVELDPDNAELRKIQDVIKAGAATSP